MYRGTYRSLVFSRALLDEWVFRSFVVLKVTPFSYEMMRITRETINRYRIFF